MAQPLCLPRAATWTPGLVSAPGGSESPLFKTLSLWKPAESTGGHLGLVWAAGPQAGAGEGARGSLVPARLALRGSARLPALGGMQGALREPLVPLCCSVTPTKPSEPQQQPLFHLLTRSRAPLWGTLRQPHSGSGRVCRQAQPSAHLSDYARVLGCPSMAGGWECGALAQGN